MGAFSSRQNAGVEEVDVASNHAYKYPPKTGNYFGTHFIMGGEKFDTPQPEAYLFGENADLNFLGSRPTPFPYPPPQANEPTKTLKSLVNIRKESLRLVKAAPNPNKTDGGEKQTLFNIEFVFDSDARTTITIYYFATEEVTPNGVVFTSKEPTLTSETYHYQKGANQQFVQPSHVFDPTKYLEEDLLYNPEKEIIPIAIHCIAQENPDETRQSHTCIAVVERHSDGTYVIKALKQKIFVDGLSYLLQEIYGIENKNIESTKNGNEVDTEDNGSECVICMCDVRDTLILPCRHLCLCNSCADSLRYQANNCPICRAPFRALLQIRALQKSASTQIAAIPPEGSCENIPSGYEGVSLIEALNGPYVRPQPTLPDTLETPDGADPASVISRSSLERSQKSGKTAGNIDFDPETTSPTESNGTRMTVLLARDGDGKDKAKSPSSGGKKREKQRHKDTVKLINETVRREQDEQEEELDSEAEKLSPLLDSREESKNERTPTSVPNTPSLPGSPQHEEQVPLDVGIQTDEAGQVLNQVTCVRDGALGSACAVSGEDSDYYTPEDPTTTILSPLHAEKEGSEIGCKWSTGLPSLPGTPQSNASHRSSGDSYSSSGSTRLLLNAVERTTSSV